MRASQWKHLSEDVKLLDITDDYCVLGVFGPKSRDLMKDLSEDDYSNENFKKKTSLICLLNHSTYSLVLK